MTKALILLTTVLLSMINIAFADNKKVEQCLLQHIAASNDSMTVGELRKLCQQQILEQEKQITQAPTTALQVKSPAGPEFKEAKTDHKSAIDQRLFMEKKDDQNPFALSPHKPNYVIFSNNMGTPNAEPFESAFPNHDVNLQHWETKFQISLKLALVRGVYHHKGDLYVAYTNRSFWQQFNKKGSSPFRDSNHEPEAWLSFKNDFELFGFKNSIIRVGAVHQSNGQAGSLSRSWNRLYTDFIVEKGNWYFSLKPWWRIPEDKEQDDNPDIQDYMGHFEFGSMYKYKQYSFDLLLRNNLHANDNRGAVQLGFSFPLTGRLRGYVQWFNGYGESLIDYNANTNSIGFGIQLSNWL